MKHIPLLASLCGCLSVSAWAQSSVDLAPITIDGDQPVEPGLALDQSSGMASRLGLSVRETPASVAVANRNDIERRGAQNFQDAANSLPGVNASAPPGFGGFVSYRGFSNSQITQMFNGINVSSGLARPVDSWIYDRVELLGGPSSLVNGAGSVGGSLNYVSKLADRQERAIEGRVSYGSYDTTQTAFGLNHALSQAGDEVQHYARLDVSHNTSNGYIDRQERDAWSLAFSLLSDLTPDLSHTLAVEYQDEHEDSPYWGTPVLNPKAGELKIDKHNRFNNYNVEDGRYEQRTIWVRSIVDYRINDSTSLRNTLYHLDSQRDYRNLETYQYNADNSAVNRSTAYQVRHQGEQNGNQFELRHDTSIFGLDSTWSGGFEYKVNRTTNSPLNVKAANSVDPNDYQPGHFYDLPGTRQGFVSDKTNEVTTQALFVENRLALTDRLALLTGLRYDNIDLDVTNHRQVTASNPRHLKRRWEPVTGRVGLSYQFLPSANVYVQYSTAAEQPNNSTQDFDVSTGKQWEVGSKFDYLDGRGSATLAAYRIERKDFAVTDPLDPTLSIPVGQQTSKGIEVASSLRVTPKLLLEGNFAWVDAQYDEFTEKNAAGVVVSRKGNTPTNVPDRVGNLWLTYDLAPQWQTGVDARYVASVYADTANTLTVPSYTLYGTFLTYKLDSHTAITGRVRNLTDEVYARFAHVSPAYYLGTPRTFELAVQSRF
ncbi:Outer membrane vitamin B12 receptor BtuB [Pseudomonas chlororaphis subsp. aurantiaca]|uniref:TonB-dependent receptor n=1 Tax=Pseudomonas chlororaphis TaxID=587753 RepID=UPI000F588A08|nr:TonB-dependent receptor [Pseudomonas chlororaphis]AZD35354.1 Outer membrane vitamin B12 receptor BtuB [Pseudomonas chlororaphis subsp. aurantiaca]AZD41687.1 Outer membrane vitamin B12 receptor BtuB [Pseudomonas chlororaphis subsp. aurantiaca]AZD60402.1 Outer membrane vitamin B12 receptor BtuB [Pseudomonas chlororaphis subsp. aurantiaca]